MKKKLFMLCLLVAGGLLVAGIVGCATNGQSPVVETTGKVLKIVADPNVLEAIGSASTAIGVAGGGVIFLAAGLIINGIVVLIKKEKKGETK